MKSAALPATVPLRLVKLPPRSSADSESTWPPNSPAQAAAPSRWWIAEQNQSRSSWHEAIRVHPCLSVANHHPPGRSPNADGLTTGHQPIDPRIPAAANRRSDSREPPGRLDRESEMVQLQSASRDSRFERSGETNLRRRHGNQRR